MRARGRARGGRRKAAAALRPLIDTTRASVLTPVVLLLQGEQQPRLGWWGRRCRRTRGPEPRPGPERSVRLPVPGAGRGGGESGPRSTAQCFLAARPRATALCPAPKTRLALGRGRGCLSPFGAALCARLPALRRGVTAQGVPSPGGKSLLKAGSEKTLLSRSLLHLPLSCRLRGKYLSSP